MTVKYEPNRQPADISVGTACQQRNREHLEIERQLADFMARGGRIQEIPRGVSGTQDGLYGYTMKHLSKKQQRQVARLFDDEPDEVTTEE